MCDIYAECMSEVLYHCICGFQGKQNPHLALFSIGFTYDASVFKLHVPPT